MFSIFKKYPAESMGIYFSTVFMILAIVSLFIKPINNVIIIPLPLAIIVFTCLLFGLIGIYLYSIWSEVSSWKKWAELFIMLSAICAALSDGFWIFATVATIIIIIGHLHDRTLVVNYPILYGWGLMVVGSFISSFFALDSKFLSFGASFGLLLYALFFLAVYNQNFFQKRGEEFLQRIGILLSSSIISTVIFSLWHYNIPYHIYVLIFQFQPYTGTDSLGMASIYGQWPTHSSAFLSLAFWVLIGIYNSCSLSNVRKKIISTGIVFALIGALATLSRNAFLFLALSIGIALLILIIKTNHKKWFYLLIGCIVFFSSILIYLVTNFQKWRELFTNPLQQVTIADRIAQYTFAITQLQTIENPLFGIGLMNFGPYYRRIMQNDLLTDYLHQLLLSITLEMGYIGLVVFFVLFFLIGYNIVINYKNNNRKQVFVVVFFAWIATGIFDNWLYFMWSSTLFIILIALGSKQNTERY